MLYSFPCPLPSPARPLSSAICNIRGTFHSFIPALPGRFGLCPGVCVCACVCRLPPEMHTPFPHHCLWFIECLGGLMEVCPPGTSVVMPQTSEVPDPSNPTSFLLTVPFLPHFVNHFHLQASSSFISFHGDALVSMCACLRACASVRACGDEQ